MVKMETVSNINPTVAPHIKFTRDEVFPGFAETGTHIQYNNIKIMPALYDVRAVYTKIPHTASITGALRCTRFFVDGKNFELYNITFDQTGCHNVPQKQRTPIIFSGAFAQKAIVENITVINGELAVAVLGGDSGVYAYQPLVDVSGNVVSNITFEYTADSGIPEQNKYISAAYARADGVATVAECEKTALSPGLVRTQTCAVQKVFNDPPCLMPGECIDMTLWLSQNGPHAPTVTNNPCCKNISGTWDAIYNPVNCSEGFMCAYKNPIGSTTNAIANSSNYPNYRITCSENMCNCKLGESCVQYNETNNFLHCTAYTNAHAHENQTWEFDTLCGVDYSHITNNVSTGTLGVGYGPQWWTIDITNTTNATSLEGFPLGVVNVSDTDTLLVIFVRPSLHDPLTEYGGNLRLSLDSDQFFAAVQTISYVSSVYYAHKPLFDDLYGEDRWCVNVNNHTNQLELTACKSSITGNYLDNITQFYIDVTDTRIHVAGNPFMCITSTLAGALFLQPCAPCAIGSEGYVPCETTTAKNQWFSVSMSSLSENQVEITSLQDNNVQYIPYNDIFPIVDPTFTLIHPSGDNKTYCLTSTTDNDTLAYELCNPCIWETLQLRRQPKTHENLERCRNAMGIQQLACTKHFSGGLYDTIKSEAFCGQYAGDPNLNLDGSNYGVGATGICDGTLKITKRGYGYFVYEILNMTVIGNSDPIDTTLPKVYAQTRKVLLQPHNNTSFSINSRGVEIINISEYTGIFGAAIEHGIFPAPAEHKTIYITANILLGCANIFLVILHIALIFIGDNLQRKIIANT